MSDGTQEDFWEDAISLLYLRNMGLNRKKSEAHSKYVGQRMNNSVGELQRVLV